MTHDATDRRRGSARTGTATRGDRRTRRRPGRRRDAAARRVRRTARTRPTPEVPPLRPPVAPAARARRRRRPGAATCWTRCGSGSRTGPGGPSGLVIHDLGCGTGSMGRWLAPRLDGAQHWVLHDRDPYLLHLAAVAGARVRPPTAAASPSRPSAATSPGSPRTPWPAPRWSPPPRCWTCSPARRSTRSPRPAPAPGCPALLTLSVAGRVELSPGRPAGRRDRRRVQRPPAARRPARPRRGHRGLRGLRPARRDRTGAPEPVAARPRGGRADRGVAARLGRRGRGAAPELAERAEAYLAARLAACAAGELRVVVHHSDLLAWPGRRAVADAAGDGDRCGRAHAPRRSPAARRAGARPGRCHVTGPRGSAPARPGSAPAVRARFGTRRRRRHPRGAVLAAGHRRLRGRAAARSTGPRCWRRSAIGAAHHRVQRLALVRWWPAALGIRLPLGAAVADYYRALFLNAALPGGVLGDVHRAVRHGQERR